VSSYQELNDKNSGRIDRKFREFPFILLAQARFPTFISHALFLSTPPPSMSHPLSPQLDLFFATSVAGYLVVGSQLVNLALLSDFVVEHLSHSYEKKPYLPTSV